jgi:hypothetical protein
MVGSPAARAINAVLTENVIAESARAETVSALDVEVAKPALPESTAVIALGPSG